MNLEELKRKVDSIYKLARDPELITVCVTTDESSMGARAFSKVTDISKGFDWEANQIRIQTEHKLIKNIDRK